MNITLEQKLSLRYASIEQLLSMKEHYEKEIHYCSMFDLDSCKEVYTDLKSLIERRIKRRIKRIMH